MLPLFAAAPPLPTRTPVSPEIFTVFARDVPFRLTRNQLETDSPNYFTSAFLSHDFSEATTRVIYTDKHPQLFALVVEHLSGYSFLPLQTSSLPPCMSVEVAHENLLRDARYFGLDQLETLLCPPSASVKHPVEFPAYDSSIPPGPKVYPLDRVCPGGDLVLDSRIRLPYNFPDALRLVDGPDTPLFVIKNVAMRFVLVFLLSWLSCAAPSTDTGLVAAPV